MVKFLIIGDLHGAMPKLYFKPSEFDAIIAPGDFCSDAPRRYMFQALRILLENRIEIEWYDICGRKKALKMIIKSLNDGRRVLEFLNSLGKPVFITPGNWDWTSHKGEDWKILRKSLYNKLIKGLKNIHDLHMKSAEYNNITLIGHGITSGPEYPQKKKDIRMLSRKELRKRKKDYNKRIRKLSKLFKKSMLFRKSKNKQANNKKTNKPVIFLTHNVPYNTKLDLINNKSSPRHGQHFGSVVAREIIKKFKPLVTIGGHMHEHFGKQKIGRTIAINAGFGGRVNTLLEVENNKIKSIRFINNSKDKDINKKVGWK